MPLPFISSNLGLQQRDSWVSVGWGSSYPNITTSTSLSGTFPCARSSTYVDGCRAFLIPHSTVSSLPSAAVEVRLEDAATQVSGGGQDQILVFQFHGKFHAIHNKCPHEAYPLSNGKPFDIEDFGIRLSAGITCAKHGWSFDLVTGIGDHGNSRLGIWEVEVRTGKEGWDDNDAEVWVRKKQRIG